MPSRWTMQGSLQEAKIEDLLQEIAQLKLRLSRIERRSLQTDDDDEGISYYQISSTPPSTEFKFEEFKDPLLNSPSLLVYDEPVYDVYDDNKFVGVLDLDQPVYGVLDLDQPVYDDDASKVDAQLDLVIHIISDKTKNTLTFMDREIGMTKFDHDNHLGTFIHSDTKFLEAISVDDYFYIVDQFEVKSNSTLEECCLQVLLRLQLMLKSLQDGANDTGWKYPDRFSQPNPPPYGGQPDMFL